MTTLSFTFSTGGLIFVALSGTKANPVFLAKDKISLPANHSPSQMTSWFENQLSMILNNIQPDVVNYKLTINNVSNSMVQNCYYGQAILNLLCHKKNINISHTSPSSIVVSKFGLAKGANLHDHIENQIGSHPPYWDSKMKDTALIALMNLM